MTHTPTSGASQTRGSNTMSTGLTLVRTPLFHLKHRTLISEFEDIKLQAAWWTSRGTGTSSRTGRRSTTTCRGSSPTSALTSSRRCAAMGSLDPFLSTVEMHFKAVSNSPRNAKSALTLSKQSAMEMVSYSACMDGNVSA